jgi:hypothetical protein
LPPLRVGGAHDHDDSEPTASNEKAMTIGKRFFMQRSAE